MDIELFKTDYVVLFRHGSQDFLRFPDGEIIIYGDLKTAHKDAVKCGGSIACCTHLFKYKQDLLRDNIRQYRIRNSKK